MRCVLKTGNNGVNDAVFKGYLRFTVVGPEGVEVLIEVAGEDIFKRKEIGCFVGGVAYHDSLVACSAGINAGANFGALLTYFFYDVIWSAA